MVKKDAAKSLIENLFPTLRYLKILKQPHPPDTKDRARFVMVILMRSLKI